MAGSRVSQTAPGKAVYRLHTSLRVPAKPDLSKPLPDGGYENLTKPVYLSEGDEVTADQLEGLQVAALVKGGFVEKVFEPQVPCELCDAQGSKEQKAKRYNSSEELAAHYRDAHIAFQPSEEV